MGDMADILLDQTLDEWGESDCWYEPSPRRVLRCRSCRKPNLIWRKILDQWVMFESDTKVHTCGGYEPPIDVLKHIAAEVIAKTQEEIKWKNFDRAKKRGGLLKLLPVIPDDQLVDLYACFVRDDHMMWNRPEYDKEIVIVRTEILRRMTK